MLVLLDAGFIVFLFLPARARDVREDEAGPLDGLASLGFAEAESDGIVQVSTGGAEYLSGPTVKDMVTGSLAFAAYARTYPMQDNYRAA